MKTPNLQAIVQTLVSDKIGLSQTEIANECGCTQPSVSHILNGVWGNVKPSLKMATALSDLAEKHNIDPYTGKIKRAKKVAA